MNVLALSSSKLSLGVNVPQSFEDYGFEDYVVERSVALQRFAFLVTGHREDARDVVQEALLGLYRRFDRVQATGGVDAYVHRSIVNAAITRWRKNRRSTPVAEVVDLPLAPGFAEDVADADTAWRLCATLPPEQRAAVVLRYWRDLSFAEIGKTLGCAEATARSRVRRALIALRAQLPEDDDD